MGYIKALEILPPEIVEQIQNYIEGEVIYIPKRKENKKSWGTNTNTKEFLLDRNKRIYDEYMQGDPVSNLADKYYLTEKSIRRIIYQQKIATKE